MDKSIKLLSAAVALAMLAPSASYATNGYFMIGAGAKTRGMGGAGIAYGQDSLAAASNPATAIDVGSRFDIGGELFRPIRAVKHNSATLPADEQSSKNLFLIPSFGISWQKSENIVYNFVMMGAGLGTNYDQTEKNTNGTLATCPANYFYSVSCGATKEAGVDMMQVHMLPGMAYKINDTHSIGVNLDFAINRFRATGLQSFADLGYTSDSKNLTNNGYDYNYGAGIRIGWQGKFNHDKLKLGAYYASKVFMTRFKKYKGLFAEGGKFDVPPHFGVGISVKATRKINVAFDIQYIQYSEVPSISNPGPDANDPVNFFPPSLCPGADKTPCLTGGTRGMGFGWKDQTVYKFGFDYAASKKMTWRFGYNYGKMPIPESQGLFNMLAPAVVEEHVTFGATYDWDKATELSFNFMHAFKNTLRAYSNFYPPGITNRADMQTGNVALSMEQTSLGFSYGYKF